MSTSTTLHICFSTHWDREWIQSFEEYRFRLVRLFDRLLDILKSEPALRFFFDGQTIVLEDYLEVRPEHAARIEALCAANRLRFGPWYILADQFLESDEATVRNLQVGTAIAARYGGPVLEGYNPDSFGSVATMPMILNGFGIRYSNSGRGIPELPEGKCLFHWEWKDGSRVLAMKQGYGNAIDFAYPCVWDDIERHAPTVETVRKAIQTFLEKRTGQFPGTHLYASIGVDHMEMRPGMQALISEALKEIPGVQVQYSTPEEYIAAAEAELQANGRELPRLTREMRGDAKAPMTLQAVLSTDIRLKQRNRRAELALTRLHEPLAAWRKIRGNQDENAFLRHAWKLLLKSHPHDSICACSRDEVMADIHNRFDRLEELLQLMRERWIADASHEAWSAGNRREKPAVWMMNALPGRGLTPFDALVRVPHRYEPGDWQLLDRNGKVVGDAEYVASRCIDLETHFASNKSLAAVYRKEPNPKRDWALNARWENGLSYRPDDATYTLFRIRGVADLGKFAGTRTFEIAPGKPLPARDLVAGEGVIENGYFRVSVGPDGFVTIENKSTRTRWEGLGRFEDRANSGDTYDFNPLEGDIPLYSGGANCWDARFAGSQSVELETVTEFTIPRQLAEGAPRQREILILDRPAVQPGRRSDETVTIAIRTTYTLHRNLDRVEIRVEFDNQAIHHRLRAVFPCAPETTIQSGSHFAALDREWQDGTSLYTTFPFTDYLHLQGNSAPAWSIAALGLHEAEALQTAAGSKELLVTLCNSTDTIGPGAGINLDTEHAKLLGPVCCDFAVFSSGSVVETYQHAARFLTPVFAEGTRAAFEPEPWYHLEGDGLAFSCMKPAQDGTGTILRFYNLTAEPTQATVHWRWPFRAVERVELNEQPSQKTGPANTGEGITQPVAPFELITLKFIP